MPKIKIAVVGSTGLVGDSMIKILHQRKIPFDELLCVASATSLGKNIVIGDRTYKVISIEEALSQAPTMALFSAGGALSLEYAPKFAEMGTIVIDNSSAWRMNKDCPLVVPEVNSKSIKNTHKIIANPNCSTIQMVLPLAGLHKKYKIKRIVVSTYQSVSGSGRKGINQLMEERKNTYIKDPKNVYPHPIDLNVIPHIDIFEANGNTKEENKIINETRKILEDDTIAISATAVRVPTVGGHGEAVNIEMERNYEIEDIKTLLSKTNGVWLYDDIKEMKYPTPIQAEGSDEVYVGRIRRDISCENGLNMWIVSDNLRKGAATNAVQIAEYIIENLL